MRQFRASATRGTSLRQWPAIKAASMADAKVGSGTELDPVCCQAEVNDLVCQLYEWQDARSVAARGRHEEEVGLMRLRLS